ncbi:MAG: two-component system, OmpR family, sensor histidine kinase ResE [Thermosediminibacterales bacterium]|nr:two-component system, OmpR family, sensor histidine kinase ResE [Thermosediminibacterales bacterium]
MFKNLFSRLFVSYLGIIVITLLSMGILLSHLFQNYYFNSKQNELIREGKEIARILVQNTQNRLPDETAEILLKTLDNFLDSRLFVINTEGRIVASTAGKRLPRGLKLNTEETARVLKGETVTSIGFHPLFNQAMIAVAVPIKMNNKIIGGLLLRAPIEGATAVIFNVRQMIVYAALGGVILSAVIGIFLSKSISKPLKQMSRASLQMARGDFNHRIEVTSQDEVGQLAQSFNTLTETLSKTITALSTEKSKIEKIVENMAEGVIAIDKNGGLILANAQAEEHLGLKEINYNGMSVENVLKPQKLAEVLNKVLIEKESSSTEIVLDNEKLIFLVHASPIQSGEEDLQGAVAVLQDITAIRKLEQMRRDFVANVSHELRTPLTSIQGFIEAMIDGLIDEKESQEKYLNMIHEETLRLNRLVTDLLDLALLESGKVQWEMKPISLPEITKRVIDKMKALADNRNIKIINNINDNLSLAYGNEDRIEQVLINLISNAINFTPEKGTVTVFSEEMEQYIKISVQDTGIGIPKEDIENIWQRFHKVDKSRTRKTGGTGLGLAIVKNIIEVHGGEVSAESSPGKGSIFSFTLPKMQN